MQRYILLVLLGCCLMLGGTGTALAQQDSLSTLLDGKKLINRPTKIALLAASFPGLGQAYNKQYWKIPLVYGGFVVFASLIDFNNERYVRYRDALALRSDGDDTTNPTDPILLTYQIDGLRRARDFYRRNRDYNIILTIGWYGLTIADAVVDAHLLSFDINNNLAGRIRPAVLPAGNSGLAPGVGVIFALK